MDVKGQLLLEDASCHCLLPDFCFDRQSVLVSSIVGINHDHLDLLVERADGVGAQEDVDEAALFSWIQDFRLSELGQVFKAGFLDWKVDVLNPHSSRTSVLHQDDNAKVFESERDHAEVHLRRLEVNLSFCD